MTIMEYYVGYSNVTFLFIVLVFLFIPSITVCNDVAGAVDAGKASANVAANNQTNLNNGTSHDQEKNLVHKVDKAAHGNITNVDDKKHDKATIGGHPAEGEKKNQTDIVTDPTVIPFAHVPSLNPGALRRAFYVFAGLSVIVLAYLMIRSFGFKKNSTQMVRKYGVLAHKQDIEMRPLPLDDDDEDDTTVFDISGLSPQRHQNQTS